MSTAIRIDGQVRRWLARVAVLLPAVDLAGWCLGVRSASPAQALGNNLALTPPMGWNDWNAYGCNVSETLVKQTADKIASSGWPPPATST